MEHVGSHSGSKYAAFISYRHLPRDAEVARLVQRAIESYRLPRGVVAAGPGGSRAGRSLGRCFRDEDELAASHSLPDSIRDALARSRFLVVVCSPQTRESAWVKREIEAFIALHGRERIVCVLAEGDAATSIPPALRTRLMPDAGGVVREMPAEPLAADLRPGVASARKAELLRVIAAVAGCGYDDLRRRERRRLRTRIAAGASGALAVAAVVAVLAFQAHGASQQALIAESRSLAVESQAQLARGERMQAIQTALDALPAPGEGGNRPLDSAAEQALYDALRGCSDSDGFWRPVFAIDAQAAIVDVACDIDGQWVATLDAAGTVEAWHLVTGARLCSFSVSAALSDPEGFDADEWGLKVVGRTRLLVFGGAGEGGAFCLDVSRAKVAWRRAGVFPISASLVPDQGLVALFFRTDAEEIGALAIDVETGKTEGAFLFGSAGGSSIDPAVLYRLGPRTPSAYREEGGTAFVAPRGTVMMVPAAFGADVPDATWISTGGLLPSGLYQKDGILVAASLALTNAQGVNNPYAVTAWDLAASAEEPLWRAEGVFSSVVSGSPGRTSRILALPHLPCGADIGLDAVVCTAGNAVSLLSLADGAELYREAFAQPVLAAQAVDLSGEGDALVIVLADGSLAVRFPLQDVPDFRSVMDSRLPGRSDLAAIAAAEQEDAAAVYAIARSAELPSRAFVYRLAGPTGDPGGQLELDQMIELARLLLEPGPDAVIR